MINHCNICRTSHWRILRRAVECISYSVGRWRMCNPIAPQLSLRQVPLRVVWQLLALSVGAGASNHRFCWSVISSYMHVIFSLPKILLLPLCWVECWIAKIVGLRLCGWTLPHLYTRKVLRLGLGKCGIRIWIARVFIQIVLNLNCIALTAHDRSPIRLVTFSVGPKWHTRKWESSLSSGLCRLVTVNTLTWTNIKRLRAGLLSLPRMAVSLQSFSVATPGCFYLFPSTEKLNDNLNIRCVSSVHRF